KRKIVGDEDPETKDKNLNRGQIRCILDVNNESMEPVPIIRSVQFHPTLQVGLGVGRHGVALNHNLKIFRCGMDACWRNQFWLHQA
ncbi:unnamed protein product, partial [Allacma fusca]